MRPTTAQPKLHVLVLNTLGPLRYTYKVSRGASSYKGEEVQVGATGWSDSKRTIYDRHGIRIVFTVSGKVGRWDFQNFILRESPNRSLKRTSAASTWSTLLTQSWLQ